MTLPLPNPILVSTAVTVIGEPKTSGRTEPFQILCEANGELYDYVVKLWAHPEVSLGKHSLAREVYGSLLAKSLGMATPDVSLVIIEPDFYRSQPNSKSELFHNSTGFNFGSKYLPQAKIISSPVPQSRHLSAVKIFCFDMLIGNPDRRIGKANLFDMGDEYVVFDHEQAFPFSRPQMYLGGFPSGWEFIKEGWSRNHVLFPSIHTRGCGNEIDDFVENVRGISDELLDTIEEQIPEDWRTNNDLQNIKNYLANTRDHVNLFKRSLQEILG